jgi:hypothetical protein
MRRAIALAVASGLVLGGVSAALPALAGTHGASKHAHGATTRRPIALKTTALKTIVYHGYQFKVPASWPVYRLDLHPSSCVRYDVHAVYLGTPGANMRCPAGLIGRTQTISVIPSRLVAAGAVREIARTPARGTTVLATYGTDPAVVKRVLATLRRAPAAAVATAQSASAVLPAERTARRATPAVARGPAAAAPAAAGRKVPRRRPHAGPTPQPTGSSWLGVPVGWPVQIVLPPPRGPKPRSHIVSGFDACTAPSLQAMHAWRSQYAGVGVYIGGVNAACAYGNLSKGWVAATHAMGWGLIPTYVGPQAPCYGNGVVVINPRHAAAQGRAAAVDAVRDAALLGLRAGSPVYYDMEAYAGGASCTNAVLAFLGAWDRAVKAAGYVTAVYSSQDSGITDMQNAAVAHTRGFTPPDAIWFALWDGRPTLNDGSLVWPKSERAKQYLGPHDQTIGGFTVNIDSDIIGGPLAG